MKTNNTACYCIFWAFGNGWDMQHGLPCMHTYLTHRSINTKKSISSILVISHTHKKLHTQRHRKSLCTIVLVLSSLTSARTITHHMEKELTLCCINLTTNCCRAPSPFYCLLNRYGVEEEKLQLIMPVVVATYAWGNGSSEGWIGGNSKVRHTFFFTNAEMSLG